MIRLRGHHLICLHFFKGEGYSPEFIEHLQNILKRIDSGEDPEVCSGPDDVCRMCPYLKKQKCIYDENADAEIKEMDRTAMRLLEYEPGAKAKWFDIRKKIPGIFHEWRKYCLECAWRSACEKTKGQF